MYTIVLKNAGCWFSSIPTISASLELSYQDGMQECIYIIYICFPEKIEKWWRDMKSNASRFYWDATFLSLFHHLLGLLMCSIYIYIHRSTRTECTRTSHAWNTWRLSWQDDNLSSWMGLGKIYRLSPWLSPWEAFAVPWKSTVNGCQSTNPCWDVFFHKKKKRIPLFIVLTNKNPFNGLV